MEIGDSCGKCKCGGELKVINEWSAVWVLQCLKCWGFAFKWTDKVTNDPADAYDRSLITNKEVNGDSEG